MNRYTSVEAKRLNPSSKFFFVRLIVMPVIEFAKRFFSDKDIKMVSME